MTASPKKPNFDVAIVGLGPTGATLAALLGLQGLSVLVLEREPDFYDLPRAVHFDDETMRVLQWVRIADRLKEKIIINPGARFVDLEGNVLVDWSRPTTVTENGWHASYRFHQPDLECELRVKLDTIEGVDIRLGHLVEKIEDRCSHVAIDYRDVLGDQVGKATASFAVGCDGARSMVRRSMSVSMTKLGFEQRWLVIDVLLKRDMPELGRHTLQFCNPERPATFCCNVGNRRRWEFALLDDEQDADMAREDTVWSMLERWIGPDDAELERIAIYTFKSEVAESWLKGRMMLAGDAAHLTPPFMGQGLCAGIRDAANLAWKLAYNLRMQDQDALLATYQSERKPHVTEYIELAARMGALVNEMDAGNRSMFGTESEDGQVHMKSIKPSLGPGLGDASDKNRSMLFPQFILRNGKRLDDHVGHEFFLAIDGRASLRCTKPVACHVLSTEDEPGLQPILSAIGAKAVLVRPDKHILASATSIDDVGSMLRGVGQSWI